MPLEMFFFYFFFGLPFQRFSSLARARIILPLVAVIPGPCWHQPEAEEALFLRKRRALLEWSQRVVSCRLVHGLAM